MKNRILFFCCVIALSINGQTNLLPKSGNLGLSTLNPRVKLDVNGITYSNSLILGDMPIAKIGLFQLKYTGNNQDTTLFLIENYKGRVFQISNNGIVRAREIIVDLETNWPDYVFQKNYSLPSLKSVESFIQSEGHLPNIPAASVMEKDGISLGEMNRILLEKVEELTLYLIDQNKRIEQLEKEIVLNQEKK